MSPKVLKACAAAIAAPCCHIFNLSIQQGVVPSKWKASNVVPVFKKGDKQDVSNYRPISLLPILSKVMERYIYNKIYPVLKPLIHSSQHGFSSHRSTATQLTMIQNYIGKVMDDGGQVDCIYLDFSKAFDSVPHRLLLHKIQMFGICGRLHKWLASYLEGRQQRVVINGAESSLLDVVSGVPQGSILGPLLFLLYVNDMPNVVDKDSLTGLFADDAKVCRHIKSLRDCQILQNDLKLLNEWAKKWGMKFNPQKCQCLTFTRKRNPFIFDYSINGVALERVDSVCDLGVHMQSDMTWNKHVDSIVSSANRKWALVRRVIGINGNQKTLTTLYQTLIRSQLEYCSTVWSTASRRNLLLIEGVQRRVTRHILGHDQAYNVRLQTLGLLPLSYRREISDIMFLSEYILTGLLDRSTNVQFISRRGDNYLLNKPRFRTEAYANSFFVRVVDVWNALPVDGRETILSGTGRGSIRTYLEQFYWKKTAVIDPTLPCSLISSCRCFTCRP